MDIREECMMMNIEADMPPGTDCPYPIGETGGHWDTGSIGTPPLIENP